MKKLINVLVIIFLLVVPSIAGLINVEEITTSTFYDFTEKDLFYGLITPIFDWELASLDVGIITDAQEILKPAGCGSLDLQILAEKLGAKYRPLESIKIGVFIAPVDIKLKKVHWGPYVGAEVKF